MILPVLLSLLLAGLVLTLGSAIAFGTRQRPQPLASLTTSLQRLGAMRFPAMHSFQARDGAALAYRAYPSAKAERVAILLHGSIHDSRTMHTVGALLAMQGVTAYALDVRGHGQSGRRGDIDHVGQLEDDIVDFVAHLRHSHPQAAFALVGHSAGGGFTLRFAGSAHAGLFDRYVAVAPFLHHDRALTRSEAVEWAVAAVPRFTALQYLHAAGLPLLQRLPVLLCAVPADSDCTTSYSFRLALNFRPQLDWRANVRAIHHKTAVLIGDGDELFDAEAYVRELDGLNPQVDVQVLKGTDHTTVCMKGSAVMAIRKALV